MDKAFKILLSYLIITLISEPLAMYLAYVYKNNLPQYHIYGLIQYVLLCSYYIYATPIKNKYAKIAIISFGILVSIINSLFIQNPFKVYNSNVTAFSSFVLMLLSLNALYVLLESDEIDIMNNPHFWITTILLIFWSFTFFYWVIGTKLNDATIKGRQWLDVIFMSINYLAYSGFAVVFWLYPKMKKA